MPKEAKKLTVKEIQALPAGNHTIGGVKGLCVYKDQKGQTQFFIRWRQNGKLKSIFMPKGISLEDARKEARKYRVQIDAGSNPKENRDNQKRQKAQLEKQKAVTFSIAYEAYCENQKQINRWRRNPQGALKQDLIVRKHLLPVIGDKPLKEIETNDIAGILVQLATNTSRTCDKVKSILNGIYNWAHAANYGDIGDYSPMGNKLDYLLKEAKKHGKKAQHHPALPVDQIPDFVKCLFEYNSITARLLIFSILTCTRLKAAREAKRSDIDFDKGIYTVQLQNDKEEGTEEQRKIFLAPQVIDWIRSLPEYAGGYLFPGRRLVEGLTTNSVGRFINRLHEKKLKEDGIGWVDPKILKDGHPRRITAHGTARSSYRTWAAERNFNHDASEYNLLHFTERSEVERAYNRASLEKERREIMNAWVEYCLSKVTTIGKS